MLRTRISKAPATGPVIGGETEATTGVGGVVSTLKEPGMSTERPVRRTPSCRRERPSRTRSPSSVRPSHTTFTGRPGRTSSPSARRRTRSPSGSTIVAVTRSACLAVNVIRSTSPRPSPLGEKNGVTCVISATDGAFLRRWATKKAANVAATSSTKTTRARRVMAPPRAGSGRPVAADDDRDRRAIAGERLGVGIHRPQVGDMELAADLARLPPGVAAVEDRRGRALLVREVARRAALVPAAHELVRRVRGEAGDRRAVEHRHGRVPSARGDGAAGGRGAGGGGRRRRRGAPPRRVVFSEELRGREHAERGDHRGDPAGDRPAAAAAVARGRRGGWQRAPRRHCHTAARGRGGGARAQRHRGGGPGRGRPGRLGLARARGCAGGGGGGRTGGRGGSGAGGGDAPGGGRGRTGRCGGRGRGWRGSGRTGRRRGGGARG